MGLPYRRPDSLMTYGRGCRQDFLPPAANRVKKSMTSPLLRLFAFLSVLTLHGICQAAPVNLSETGATRLLAKDGTIAGETTEIVADDRLVEKKGVTLKAGVKAAVDGESRTPDITFSLKAPKAGLYVLHTFAVVDDEGAKLMDAAKGKYDSLFMKLQFDTNRPTKRVVYVPWHRSLQETGKFNLTGEPQELKIWLPRGVRLGYVDIRPYSPPAIPAAAKNYKPKWTPPASHPRLWCTTETLPLIRERLKSEEHRKVWQELSDIAKKPFKFEFNPDAEVAHNAALEAAVTSKAFYYLMTGDKKIGREAVQLTLDYSSRVEFGNVLDITREIGQAIYAASLVYDWCNDLLTTEEQDSLYTNLMRLALDMECGWPPFRQTIITGHGAEAQINRDLLAMSIATYEKNPEGYNHTAYVILENLVPMRNWEYQSPRFDQGVSYGAFRFAWEMHAAWLFYRMTGEPAFDDNIKDVRKFFQYMRMPDGQMLRDGDGNIYGKDGDFNYWRNAPFMLLMYTYANDPILKGDYYRQGGPGNNRMQFLLLNDPELKPIESMESLPLSMDFGPNLGGLVARTGWDISLDSNDVVAEIKGGGYHFGNHQQSDAGSLQIYYRGPQVVDLGLYKFYGTPYDMNFNKRSVAHSMMLAFDPNEKFLRVDVNDGGTKFVPVAPLTPEQTKKDPQFSTGSVMSSDFGPDDLKPAFSYFKVDLTKAYSAKMSRYTRGFCFLNLGRKDIPAAIILTDDMTTAKPEFKKYWQINTFYDPQITDGGFVLHNQRNKKVGKTHVDMLVPAPAERKLELLSGKQSTNVFGVQLDAPAIDRPEANGHRIMISPENAQKRDRFLTVFQMVDGETKPLPMEFTEYKENYVIGLADRIVSMSNSSNSVNKAHSIIIPPGAKRQVALLGLKDGSWSVRGPNGFSVNAKVASGKNAIYFEGEPGEYKIAPR